MPELKHNFTKSRMNKDLDERLVPNGEYRDAQNVEVLASDGSDVGTVQTCLGNNMISDLAPGMYWPGGLGLPGYSQCVGSVADDKTNSIYYFVSGIEPKSIGWYFDLRKKNTHLDPDGHNLISSDIIVEYSAELGRTLPVMVDIYNVRTQFTYDFATGNTPPCGVPIVEFPVLDTAGLRVGMEIEIIGFSGNVLTSPGTFIVAIPTSTSIIISHPVTFIGWWDCNWAEKSIVNAFSPRVLNFKRDRLITGVNIVDEMLYWTDGVDGTEPKKVNIPRGKKGSIPGMGICSACRYNHNLENPYTFAGTTSWGGAMNNPPGTTHTELVVENSLTTDYEKNGVALNFPFGIPEYVQEKHITVIRRGPLTPLRLDMYDNVHRFDPLTRVINDVTTTVSYDWANSTNPINNNVELPPVGMTSVQWNDGSINVGPAPGPNAPMGFFNTTADFRVDDVLLLSNNINNKPIGTGSGFFDPLAFSDDDVRIRLKVIASNSTDQNPVLVQSPVFGGLEVEVLYIDGTITTPEPPRWYVRLETKPQPLYELKFPKFAYRYKYEDGEYSAFSPFSELAFLPGEFEYHPKKGYNLGMTNGLRQLFIKDFIPPNIPLDVVEVDILYKESNSPNIYTIRSFDKRDPEWNVPSTLDDYRGLFEIKTDLIHAVVASNQLLRHWDNVPRSATAQEVTGNRLIYGNYLQNYDMSTNNIFVNPGITSGNIIKPSFKIFIQSHRVNEVPFPEPSLKSMRTYQLGIIYKDFYGRETPVLSHPSGSVKIDSAKGEFSNSLVVQTVTPPPSWAHSFKYFVKEISNEYYNLAMDRWYDADMKEYDKHKYTIWMSFPSEDRNKVDEETTLILKKSDGGLDLGLNSFVSTTPRYKILAIENEAPDFIKTTIEVMGEWEATEIGYVASSTSFGNFYHTSINSGVPFAGSKQIRIFQTDWEKSKFSSLQNDQNSILGGSILGRDSSLIMRLVEGASGGGGTRSEWYNISNIAFQKLQPTAGGDNHYVITIDGYFKAGDVGNFVGIGANPLDIVEGIDVEIAKKTMENRPEFDGRFFVKIERDDELERNLGLISTVTSDIVWNNTGTFDSFFIYGAVKGNPANSYCHSAFTPTTPGTSHGVTTLWDNTIYPGWEMMTSYYSTYTPSGWRYNEDRILKICCPYNFPDAGAGVPGGSGIAATNTGTDQTLYTPPFRFKDDWTSLLAGMESATGTSATEDGFWTIDAEPAGKSKDGGPRVSTSTTGSGNSGIMMATDSKGADVGQSEISISLIGGRIVKYPNYDWIIPTAQQITYDKLTTVGTRFRFSNDSTDRIVYEIGSVSEVGLRNYDDEYSGSGVTHSDWKIQNNEISRIRLTLTLIEPFSAQNSFPGTQHPLHKRIGEPLLGDFQTGSTSLATAYAPCNYIDIGGTVNNTDGAKDDDPIRIEFVEPDYNTQETEYSQSPAVWETEPKEDVGLDIYYEIGGAYPVNMCDGTEELYIQPGATVSMHQSDIAGSYTLSGWTDGNERKLPPFPAGAPVLVLYGAPTPTTILPGTITTTVPSNSTTHHGHQRWQDNFFIPGFPPTWGNNKILLDAPIDPNIVAGLTITDPGGIIPVGTTITNVQIIMGGTQQLLTLSQTISVPGFFSVSLQPGTEFTISGGSFPIPPTSVVTPTIVSTITGCAGLPSPAVTGPLSTLVTLNNGQVLNAGDVLLFTNPDGTVVTATVAFNSLTSTSTGQTQVYLNALVHGERHTLPYYNCYAFGNGVESNRVRDLFNAVTIDKGARASTTLAEQYKEEQRKNGLIFSGIYNSMSGVNRLNQFVMAENITKDLNPEYGSIQKLHTRDTDLITLCEDKVVKVLANKDALFNADDTKNITATRNVLGNSIPFVGEYGISKNPESFASEAFRAYFTDQERGAVLRLSRDGLTPISDIGMKDWFADNLQTTTGQSRIPDARGVERRQLIGSYDRRRSLYNLSMRIASNQWHDFLGNTISFSEKSLGWVSFKSFDPEIALSLNNEYYTGKYGWLWEHHDNIVDRNSFHSIKSQTIDTTDGIINNRSYITLLFNDLPSIIKSFNTLNYEGSQSKVIQDLNDKKYYNNQGSLGWYVNSIVTDQQIGTLPGALNKQREWEGEFINKEGKWFNYIIGEETHWSNPYEKYPTFYDGSGNLDTQEFATQGVGFAVWDWWYL